jgi:hypothetical protein
MAVVEVTRPRRGDGGQAESYEDHKPATRIRLTTDESRTISYVFSDWDSEIGLASNFEAMRAAIASQGQPDTPAQARRRAASKEPQTAVPKAVAQVFDAGAMSAIERWADRKLDDRIKILRCWRALCAMGRARNPSVIILHALYGDMPPGLPARGTWAKDVDLEYRRVVRYVDASGGSGAALDAMLLVDRRRRPGDTDESLKARNVAADASKRRLVAELGRAAEHLIVAAAHAYRAAIREQP